MINKNQKEIARKKAVKLAKEAKEKSTNKELTSKLRSFIMASHFDGIQLSFEDLKIPRR